MNDLIKVLAAKIWLVLSLFVSGVIIARVANPAEFGLYASALSLILILDGVLGSPLDTSGVRFASIYAEDNARVDRFLGALFRLKLLLATVSGAILLISARVFGVPDWSWPLIIAVAFAVLCVMTVRSLLNFLQVNFRFSTYSALDMLQATSRLILVLLVSYVGAVMASTYVVVFGLGALVVIVVGFAKIKQTYVFAESPSPEDRRAVLEHAGVVSLVIALGTITGRSDILILEVRAGAEWAGQYAVAFHMASVVSLLAGYISVVCQPRIVGWVRERTLSRFLRLNLLLGLAASIVILGVSALLPQLIVWIFGDAYLDARPMLNILLLGSCLDLLIMPILLSFALQLLPRYALVAEAVIAVGFFAVVFGSANIDPISMAWIVTGVRGLKFLFYVSLITLKRNAVQSRISL